ncbi:MAG: hypothetical protein AAF723_04290 [Pseudomonadota bacterium]
MYSVTLGKTWTAYPQNRKIRTQSLTIDGLQLNQLILGYGLRNNASLIRTPRSFSGLFVPRFRSSMTDAEIVEFIIDSLKAAAMAEINVTDVKPDYFGTLKGVSFSFEGTIETGLPYSGSPTRFKMSLLATD